MFFHVFEELKDIKCGVKELKSATHLECYISSNAITRRENVNGEMEKQDSASSSFSSDSSSSIILPVSSPERSTITPDTTKEVLENNENEEETISVDDDNEEETLEAEHSMSKESSLPKRSPPCSSGSITKNGITVELVGQHLWKKFHKLGTEMIITKAGR